MSATNYARHVSEHRRYVFLAEGDPIDPTWLTAEWAWWTPPHPRARLIGETREQSCQRTGHALQLCERCKAKLAGVEAARRDGR